MLRATLLAFELQQSMVSRPLLRAPKDRIGADNLPEPHRSIRIVSMEIRVVRLDGVAECIFEPVSVVSRTSTDQIVKSFHRYALGRFSPTVMSVIEAMAGGATGVDLVEPQALREEANA